ncbi:MAG TPA: hypothetical protein VD793_02070, partial [Gemmatimonadales bacterium]|nr:hypothetical protein [Gemmatimonadales bacterium]
MRSTTICFLLVTVATASRAGQAQTAADTASVRAFYAAWFGPAQQDPVTYASFYASDGYILPPNAPPVQGREAIAEWQRRARAEATYRVRPEGRRFLSRPSTSTCCIAPGAANGRSPIACGATAGEE